MSREAENNRQLSPAEQRRKENFEKIKEELLQNGYREKDLTVGIVDANVMTLVVATPVMLLFAVLYFVVHIKTFSQLSELFSQNILVRTVVVFAVFYALIIVHEAIHGITWSFFAKNRWKSISFGFIAKYMTPYCTCSEALTKAQYIAGSLMPTLLLGIVPGVVAVMIGSFEVLAVALLMIMSGGGDLLISLKLLQFRPQSKDVLYVDHPYQVGLVAFEKE